MTERQLQSQRERRKKNPLTEQQRLKKLEYMKKYTSTEEYKKKRQDWINSNKDKLAAKNSDRYIKWISNPENRKRKSEYMKDRYKDPSIKRKIIDFNNKRERERRLSDPGYLILRRCRVRLACAVRDAKTKKFARTCELLGCSVQELRDHIESKFKPGMSWDNRDMWHVDHIIPCARFDLTKEDQQRICFHYSNLQPLWAKENIVKGKK